MNVRGIFPSLGAGGSLTAAVLCAAAIVGGALAFRGEAGGTAEANTGDVTVPGATVRARPTSHSPARTRTVRAVAARPSATRRTAAAPRPRTSTTRASLRRTTVAPPATITPRAPAPATPPPPPRPTTTPATGGRQTPAVPVPATPSGTVTKTVAQVREVAKPVIDAVPEPAQSHVQTVTDTVQQMAGAVDQTVDGLLP
jgi:hypothetical protein